MFLSEVKRQIISGLLGLPEQPTVLEFMPTDLPCDGHFVSGETAGDGTGRAVVEENSHPRPETWSHASSWGIVLADVARHVRRREGAKWR